MFHESARSLLKPIKFYQGDHIARSGETANEMYFVSYGTAVSLNPNSDLNVAEFGPGSFFGEMGILTENSLRNADFVVTSPTLILFKLERFAITELIQDYPEIKEAMDELKLLNKTKVVPTEAAGVRQMIVEPEVIRENLKQVALFKDADLPFLNEISLKLPLRVCWPGEFVVKQGEIGTSMFIILTGNLEILSSDGSQVYGQLSKNSYFGEVSMFFGEARTASVRCKTDVTYLEIDRATLELTFSRYEKVKDSIYKVAHRNYQTYLERKTLAKDIPEAMFGVEITTSRLKEVYAF